MDIPTDIWREILTYADNSIHNKLYEMNIDELKDTKQFIRILISRRCNQIKSQLNCDDVVKITKKEADYVIIKYAIIKSLSFQSTHSIKIYYLQPVKPNATFGNFKLITPRAEQLCLTDCNIEVIQKAKDVITNNKAIAEQTNKYDIVEVSLKLFDIKDCGYIKYYAIVIKKISKNTIKVQPTYGYRLLDCININTKQVLKIVDLNNIVSANEQELFTKTQSLIELRKQILLL